MKAYIFIFFFINSSLLHASGDGDSLLIHLGKKSKKFLFVDKDSAQKYLGYYLKESQSNSNDRHLLASLKLAGIWHDIQSDYDSSFTLYHKALKVAKQLEDSVEIANVRSNIGLLENKRGRYKKAILELTEAGKIYDDLNLVEYQARVRLNIIWTYIALELYDNALRIIKEAIHLFEQTDNQNELAAIYANWAIVLNRKKDPDSAIVLYERASAIMEEMGDLRRLSSVQNNLGSLYLERGKITQAIKSFNRSIDTKVRTGDKNGLLVSLKNLAEAYKEQGNYNKALYNLQRAFEDVKKLDDSELLSEFHLEFSSIYERMGLHEKALSQYRIYTTIRDSIRSVANARTVTEIEAKYESNRKDNEIKLLAKTNEVRLSQRNIILSVAIGLFLLGGTIFYYYKQGKGKNKQLRKKNQIIEDALAEREVLLREIHHRVKNNLQIVSSLLNIQSKLLKDPSAKSAVQTGRDRIQSMALTHKLLYQNQNLSNLSLREYISQLSDSLIDTYSVYDDVILEKDIDEVLIDLDSAVNLGLLINELISNAMKHAFDDFDSAIISISLKQEDNYVKLIVSDNGKGLEEANSKKDSYGMRLIKSLSDALKGTLSIDSSNGTEVKLVMPTL